jgi:hypothetical protein
VTVPRRIQLRRVKGWRLPPGAVKVADTSKYRNPYRPAERSPEANARVKARYRQHLADHPELVEAARRELAGRDLACYCPPDLPCHADVLLEVANQPEGEGRCARQPLIRTGKLAKLDPLERQLYAGVALYCCTSEVASCADHPSGYTWRVGMVRDGDGFAPADEDDAACPECGTVGKQLSEVRSR